MARPCSSRLLVTRLLLRLDVDYSHLDRLVSQVMGFTQCRSCLQLALQHSCKKSRKSITHKARLSGQHHGAMAQPLLPRTGLPRCCQHIPIHWHHGECHGSPSVGVGSIGSPSHSVSQTSCARDLCVFLIKPGSFVWCTTSASVAHTTCAISTSLLALANLTYALLPTGLCGCCWCHSHNPTHTPTLLPSARNFTLEM